jgi:hypothetical protein
MQSRMVTCGEYASCLGQCVCVCVCVCVNGRCNSGGQKQPEIFRSRCPFSVSRPSILSFIFSFPIFFFSVCFIYFSVILSPSIFLFFHVFIFICLYFILFIFLYPFISFGFCFLFSLSPFFCLILSLFPSSVSL